MLTLSLLDTFKTGVTGFLLLIDSVVYWFLSLLFDLFEALAGAEIISQNAYQTIADRIYVVIGVVMLFFLAYSLLKALVDPEELNKSTSKIAKNAIVSIILVGLIPTFFTYAFKVQNAIISDNIIGNIIFGEGTNNTIGSTGRVMAMTSLSAFLYINDNTSSNGGPTWQETKNIIANGGDFSLITDFAEVVNEGIDGASYNLIISTICGVFLAYVALSFCLDLGIRVVKLAFYQIIAPIPVLMRIIPEKKSVFDNYVKKTLATFMEVFIRIFIMYIVVFLVSLLTGDDGLNIMSNENLNLVAKVIVFMGLFAFAKQAPKLIGEITGIDAGNIKLGIGGKLKDSFSVMGSIPIVGALGQRAIGAVTGGLGGLSTSLTNGAGFSGFGYGALNGWKGKGSQFKKQRGALYNKVYGQEGNQGLFGGQALMDKWSSSAKKSAKDAYQSGVEARVENNALWQTTYSAQEQQLRRDRQEEVSKITDQIQQLNESLKQASEDFKINQEKEQTALESLLENEKREFEISKIDRLAALREKARQASANNDNATLSQLQQAIQATESSTYSNPQLENRLNEIKNRTFDASSYNKEIASLKTDLDKAVAKASSPLDKDDIKALQSATRAQLLDNKNLDKKYKAMVKYTDNVARTKAAEEYRNSSEGMNQAAIMEEVFKKMAKDGKNIGPAGPSSSGGDKKDK